MFFTFIFTIFMSHRCLSENNWDYEKAARVFTSLKVSHLSRIIIQHLYFITTEHSQGTHRNRLSVFVEWMNNVL